MVKCRIPSYLGTGGISLVTRNSTINKWSMLYIVCFFLLLASCSPTTPAVESPVTPETIDQITTDPIPEQRETDPTPEEPAPPTTPTGLMTVHFIDVGQGDAILIQTPSQNVLIDGGERGNTVIDYLKKQSVKNLDLVIGTHPHSDHIGGLINVLQTIPVKEVIDPGVVHTTKTFEDYLTLIDEKDVVFTEGRAGMSRDLGDGATLQVLHPSSPPGSHLNDASIVTKITFGQVSFMLSGDAEESSEKEILNRGYNLRSTILKVGHHGSRTSTTSSILNAVSPEVAVIMAGKGNTYGHPHDDTLAKLDNAGVKIYRTDVHGTIVITTDGQRYEVNVKEAYQYNPPKEPEPASRNQYVGSVKSDKYHYPECIHAKNISTGNEISFSTVQDARSAGYDPCGVCRPPES